MFKKTLKVATVLTLLIGCYAGYVRVFALVVKNLESNRKSTGISFLRKKSKSRLDSIERAKRSFGVDHWTADEQTTCYIGKDFWLYFKSHEQPVEKYDGKRIKLNPVALIVRTDAGKTNVTITAEEGVFDFNQRPGLNGKPSSDKNNPNAAPEPFKVLRARVSQNVMLRHDRGTPNNPDDDLFVGPLTYADFTDENLQIVSESDVLIRDRDTRITGQQFLIQLRPKAETTAEPAAMPKRGNGFDGVELAIIRKNVHVIFNDVGSTGFLPAPGSDKNSKPASKPKQSQDLYKPEAGTTDPATPPAEPKPLDLTSAGQMTVRFPEPQVPVKVGPPPPALPTLIDFTRDVLAQIGKLDEKPDQLSCDNLELVLYPAEAPAKEPVKSAEIVGEPTGKPAEPHQEAAASLLASGATSSEEEKSTGGTFGNLALRSLKATGYAVWLKLSKQTTTIRGIELKHQKRGVGELDVTNMLGRKGPRGLTIEKVDEVAEGPNQGKVLGVTNVWGNNATIYDDGGGTNNATIYIQGPGRLETRTDRNQPAQRIAEWQDVMEVLNEPGATPETPIKRVTLVGVPFVRDLSKPDAPSSLDSSDRIITWLKPKAPGTPGAQPAQGADSSLSPTSSGYDLHHLRAFKDAHLTSPGQNISARKMLNAEFLPAPATPAATTATPSQSVVAGNPEARPAAPPNEDVPAVAKDEATKPKAPPDRKIESDIVWANVQLLTPSGLTSPTTSVAAAPMDTTSTAGGPSPQYEVREVRLFHKVVFHQDPEEGKAKGNDATGEALYLFNEGENKVRMVLFNDVPKSSVTKEGVAEVAWATPAHLRSSLPLARISTDEMLLYGPIIGMDQTKDFAWVNGPGSLKQLVDRGMMADKNPVDPTADPAKADPADPNSDPKNDPPKVQTRAGKPLSEKTELTINWTQNMRFYGRSADFENRPDSAARAEFYGHVTAITQEQDSMLDCDQKMITYTDRPVPLTRLSKVTAVQNQSTDKNRAEAASEQKPEPKADLALIEMFGNAVAVNRKVDPDRPLIIQKQRIQTDHLIYDRRTGDFTAPGEGIVYLYDRKGSEPGQMGTDPNKDSANPDRTGAEPGLRRGVGSRNEQRMGDRLVIPTAMQLDQDMGGGGVSSLEMEQQNEADANDDRNATDPSQSNFPRSTNQENRRGVRRSTAPRVAGTSTPGAQSSRAQTKEQTTVPNSDPLILTQIKFAREMRGQFGTSNKPGASETRVAEFFGDVEVVRTPIANELGIIERKDWNFRPPRDVYFLTAQTLRVITEPPPAGTPNNAPARNWMKAWDTAQLSTNDKSLLADVITYNSQNDLFYAYGEDGHQVTITQQVGFGQPGSPTRQQAVQYHPKTGSAKSVNPQFIQFIDGRTGSRPKIVIAPDPEAKPRKPVKGAIKPRVQPMERKGFSGR